MFLSFGRTTIQLVECYKISGLLACSCRCWNITNSINFTASLQLKQSNRDMHTQRARVRGVSGCIYNCTCTRQPQQSRTVVKKVTISRYSKPLWYLLSNFNLSSNDIDTLWVNGTVEFWLMIAFILRKVVHSFTF